MKLRHLHPKPTISGCPWSWSLWCHCSADLEAAAKQLALPYDVAAGKHWSSSSATRVSLRWVLEALCLCWKHLTFAGLKTEVEDGFWIEVHEKKNICDELAKFEDDMNSKAGRKLLQCRKHRRGLWVGYFYKVACPGVELERSLVATKN